MAAPPRPSTSSAPPIPTPRGSTLAAPSTSSSGASSRVSLSGYLPAESLRVASFPRPGDGTHDYIDLLADPLADEGMQLLGPSRFGPSLAGRDRPDVVHLHWIEYLM